MLALLLFALLALVYSLDSDECPSFSRECSNQTNNEVKDGFENVLVLGYAGSGTDWISVYIEAISGYRIEPFTKQKPISCQTLSESLDKSWSCLQPRLGLTASPNQIIRNTTTGAVSLTQASVERSCSGDIGATLEFRKLLVIGRDPYKLLIAEYLDHLENRKLSHHPQLWTDFSDSFTLQLVTEWDSVLLPLIKTSADVLHLKLENLLSPSGKRQQYERRRLLRFLNISESELAWNTNCSLDYWSQSVRFGRKWFSGNVSRENELFFDARFACAIWGRVHRISHHFGYSAWKDMNCHKVRPWRWRSEILTPEQQVAAFANHTKSINDRLFQWDANTQAVMMLNHESVHEDAISSRLQFLNAATEITPAVVYEWKSIQVTREDCSPQRSQFLSEQEAETSSQLLLLGTQLGHSDLWVRRLVELLTGHFTGSFSDNAEARKLSFVGDGICNRSVRIIGADAGALWLDKEGRLVLPMWNEKLRNRCKDVRSAGYDTAVVVVRNPFHAIASEFARLHSDTLNNPATRVKTLSQWKSFAVKAAKALHHNWVYHLLPFIMNPQNSAVVVKYEHLTSSELHYFETWRLARFVNASVDAIALRCAFRQLNAEADSVFFNALRRTEKAVNEKELFQMDLVCLLWKESLQNFSTYFHYPIWKNVGC